MNNPHYIVYVNGPDLLTKALDSLRPIYDNVFIVDNRDVFTQQPEPYTCVPNGMRRPTRTGLSSPCDVIKPEFPLNQAQLLTWLTMRAEREGDAWFTWSHHDSISVDGTIIKLRTMAEITTQQRAPWGLIFTRWPSCSDPWNHIDTMCAVNVKAVLSQGGWDWYRFPDYFSDYDLYGKLRKAGYVMLQSGLPIEHLQGGSMTAAIDGNRALVKHRKWAAYQALWEDRKLELGIDWPPR